MSGLAERSKVNLDLWNLFSHCYIRLNIPSENNDIGFSSFQKKKSTFQKFSHLNALGSKLVGQGQPSIII